MTDDIQFVEINSLGLITLNRPQALNALSHGMIVALYQQLATWAHDPDVKAVMIQGAGEKAFCAGGDVRKVYETKHHPEAVGKQFFWDEYRLNHRIRHYPKPYIAFLDGITMGGGVGVSLHGSNRIATERLTFAMPETAIGFFPDVGASYLLSRCAGQTGIYLGLTGARLKVADAAYLNLIDTFVPSEKKAELIDTLVSSHFGDNPQQVVNDIINNYKNDAGVASLAEYRTVIDECFALDSVEAILAALQSKPDEWCKNTAQNLLSKSPTSLKVTLQELRQAKQLDFDQCMQMEYRLAMRFIENHDFFEGVRAVLIDKDQAPKWQPAVLSDVTANDVAAYFAPLKDTPELSFELA